jgi:hypothetical protein
VSYASDAPDTIDGLRDALLACASWLAAFPGSGAERLALATAAIHYPDADGDDVDEGTEAVEADPEADPPIEAVEAVDPTPLAVLSIDGGSFAIDIAAIWSTGELEELGQDLRHELMSLYRTSPAGLVIASEPTVGASGDATGWAKSAGDDTAAISISGRYGLNL